MAYDRGVGLRTSYEKVYVDVFALARFLDESSGFFAIGVFTVSYGLCHIGFCQSLYDERMGSFIIVALKLNHKWIIL